FVSREGYNNKTPWNWAKHAGYRGMPDSSKPDLYDADPPPFNWLRITRTGINFANDFPFFADDLKPANQKAANCKAKMRTIQFLYYMQHDGQSRWSVANDEGYATPYNIEDNNCPDIPAELDVVESHLPSIPYYRESLRLAGEATLKASDIFRVPYRQTPS